MQITVTGIEASIILRAIGTALDNERDKGEDGLGQERMASLASFEESMRAFDNSGGTLDVDFLVASVLLQYLMALEGIAEDADGGEQHEQARQALIKDLEGAEKVLVIERAKVDRPGYRSLPLGALEDERSVTILIGKGQVGRSLQAHGKVSIDIKGLGPVLFGRTAGGKVQGMAADGKVLILNF